MAVDKGKARPALGRGLGALIPTMPKTSAAADEAVHAAPVAAGASSGALAGVAVPAAPMTPVAPSRRDYFMCPIEEVAPSRDNPRQRFDEQRLQELAESIRAQGLVQPLVARLATKEELAERKGEPGPRYVLIAGERRWRAAQRAGLKDVPVVVKDVDAAAAFELALVENLQREDLNPIEEAEAYRRLSDEFGYTQEELARRVGRERSTVTNVLRLLKLPTKVKEHVAAGQLTQGHAKALLELSDPVAMEESAALIVERELSVRQTEQLVKRAGKAPSSEKAAKKTGKPEKSASVRDVENRLQKALGTRVQLRQESEQAGIIEVQYHSLDELDRLIALFCGENSED